MICKDCVHYPVCKAVSNDTTACNHFKDKSRIVELPCKVGDKVYQVASERVYESTVTKIIYDTNSIAFDERAIGKSIFLTREKAEEALRKERENRVHE